MGLFDILGPLNFGGKNRRGWDALPAAAEQKQYSWTIEDQRAVIVHPLISGPGSTDVLYGARVGDTNSAVFACLQVIATAIAEPPLKVYQLKAGDRTELDDTPLGDLLARPNPHMTLSSLLAYLSNCLHIDGNGYWRKLRAGNPDTGNVVQLWPISPTRIEIKTLPGDPFISFYRYHKGPGKYDDIPVQNMVHFRMGLKDGDHRLGDGPIKRLAREVSSDEQATRYADRLLANLAINGLSLEFDKDAGAIDKPMADELKARIQSAYGGDNVGAVSVLSPGAKLVSHGFSPEQMDLKVLHRVPEERIASVLGVPAIVAGLGAGLDRSTYSNFSEARESFTEMKLVPFWRMIADTLTMSLVPDFVSQRGVSVAFMIDDVRALQDDQNAKAVRLGVYVDKGILTVDEARAEIGREPKPQAQPATQPALPAPKSLRGLVLLRKSLDDLPGEYESLREDQMPDWETALRTFLASQLRRANAQLRAGADTADGLVAEGEARLLGDTLAPLQDSVLSGVHRLVQAELGISFDLDDATTRAYLADAGANIVGITDTTRSAVRAALIAGQQAGEGVDQLAARLRVLPEFSDRRARTVARTELAYSSNQAALTNYRASGVVSSVVVWDGDYDAECAAMNGRTFPLSAPPALLQHPNCRRALAPVLSQEAAG